MSTPATVKAALQAAITKANAKTGASDTNVTDAVNTLIEGYGKGEEPSGTLDITKNGLHNVKAVEYANVNVPEPTGTVNITTNGTHDVKNYASATVNVPATGITPSGTKEITENGEYDVTNYAKAKVSVPASGITPSGTKEITENGTFDVTSFASALVNVAGVNARVYTKTLSSDSTSTVTFLTNDWLKSIRSNANAFVIIRYLGLAASTACVGTVFSANFALGYSGTTQYSSVVARQTATTAGTNFNGLLTATKYNGHANIDANGKLYAYGNATYPFKAGTYQIIAGILESL